MNIFLSILIKIFISKRHALLAKHIELFSFQKKSFILNQKQKYLYSKKKTIATL